MKCLVCEKKEATIAFTHVVEKDKELIYLCEACYAEKGGVATEESTKEEPKEKKVVTEVEKLGLESEQTPLRCSRCSMSYEEFKKLGRLGCGECYGVFRDQMEKLLKRIHGSMCHSGKGPIEVRPVLPPNEELDQLRRQLQQAVGQEAYEQAADLRDRIAHLEREPDEDRLLD